MARLTQAAADYETELQTLSEGSVNVNFDPFVDIDWDSPEFEIRRDDPRWVLPDYDPLARTAWYRGLPLDQQIEVGLWRQANIAKVGLQFEAILIRGVMQWVMTLPNQSPEFRYSLHEVTEECNHIQMFQELVNRIGADVPGMSWGMRAISPAVSFVGAYLPIIFFIGILAGEEPIDHIQKAIIRTGDDMPPALRRVMQIHIAEEARHISFAHQFIREHLKGAGWLKRTVVGLALPVIMFWLANAIVAPPPSFRRKFDIPRRQLKKAFFKDKASQDMRRDFFADVRGLAIETRLMGPSTSWMWKLLRIDGHGSRYRSEPKSFRRAKAA
ncbi:diiron oxygenase [Pseudonocardiaceae bacterium YIM PH 21723]|nr:diiron oxygenase [Pseudonocardiaceae bacterium YIM PH 21723]